MTKMRVLKTLVIGLGSTGVEICEKLIERIKWELGDVKKAPWIKFLGIETDKSKVTILKDMGDLYNINIPSEEYSAIKRKEQYLVERLKLDEWCDFSVLDLLPSGAVDAGVGNIRMIGRLAFFYCYRDITRVIEERINELRNLNPSDAMEKRGKLISGENPEIDFIDDKIRIFVVGTLCGGTCSGMSADFGYFLKSRYSKYSNTIAFFSIPTVLLNDAIEKNANRYKKNAYTALVEINHYYVEGSKNPIYFPDNQRAPMEDHPYDLIYLFSPFGTANEDIEKINNIIADRIFYNIFIPDIDPFKEAVNEPPIYDPNTKQAHVFLSTSLNYVEYPAERIIEACIYKLLSYLFGKLIERKIEPEVISKYVDKFNISNYDKLIQYIIDNFSPSQLDNFVKEKTNKINNLQSFEKEYNSFKKVFNNEGYLDTNDDYTKEGSIFSYFLNKKRKITEKFEEILKNIIREIFLDYEKGPLVLKELVEKLLIKVRELKAEIPNYNIPNNYDKMKNIALNLEKASNSSKLKIFFVKDKVIKKLKDKLDELFASERKTLLKRVVREAIINDYQIVGENSRGIISHLEEELDRLYRFLEKLYNRISDQRVLFDNKERDITKKIRSAYGVILFNNDIEEYKIYLEKKYDNDYLIAKDKAAKEIIKNWTNLLDILLNYKEHKEWLDYDSKKDSPFSDNVLQPLISKAREIFIDIVKSDVFEKWKEFYSTIDERKTKAKELIDNVKYSIELIPQRVEEGGRAPIAKMDILVMPNTQSPMRKEFLDEIQKSKNYSKNFKQIESPYNYRVLIIRELIRWPIKAAKGITELENSLYSDSLKCNDFPTFHTRKDVNWIPLNPEELERIKETKILIILGVLFDKIEIKHGKLVPNLRDENFELPLDIDKATFEIIKNDKIKQINKKLQKSIEEIREELGDFKFIQEILNKIEKGKGNEIPNWNEKEIKDLIMGYIVKDESLLKELMKLKPLDAKTKEKLYRKKGDPKPKGGEYEKDGYYCDKCGGLIGYTEEEALQNKWKCVRGHAFYELFS